LNNSNKLFSNVGLFLTFDDDENGRTIFEKSLSSSKVLHLGNTVLHMGFDNVTSYNGTAVLDSGSYFNHAEIDSGEFRINGCVHFECFEFDGSGDGLVISGSDSLDVGNEFTISMWVYFDNISQNQTQEYILEKENELEKRKRILSIIKKEFKETADWKLDTIKYKCTKENFELWLTGEESKIEAKRLVEILKAYSIWADCLPGEAIIYDSFNLNGKIGIVGSIRKEN
jgi:hypothetical protein